MKKINRLLTKWYYFLVALIVICVSFSLVVNKIGTPKKDECVSLFIASNNVNKTLKEKLNEDLPEYLELVDVNSKNENDQYIYESFDTTGLSFSDMFILPSDFVIPSDYNLIFYEIDISKVSQILNYDFEYVYFNEKAYGIKIYNHLTKEGLLKEYISYTSTKDYYLFFNINSVQLGILNNTNNGIFDITKRIIELS